MKTNIETRRNITRTAVIHALLALFIMGMFCWSVLKQG